MERIGNGNKPPSYPPVGSRTPTTDRPVSRSDGFVSDPGQDPSAIPSTPMGSEGVHTQSITARTVTTDQVRQHNEWHASTIIAGAAGIRGHEPHQLVQWIAPFLIDPIWTPDGRLYRIFLDAPLTRILENFGYETNHGSKIIPGIIRALAQQNLVEETFDPTRYYEDHLALELRAQEGATRQEQEGQGANKTSGSASRGEVTNMVRMIEDLHNESPDELRQIFIKGLKKGFMARSCQFYQLEVDNRTWWTSDPATLQPIMNLSSLSAEQSFFNRLLFNEIPEQDIQAAEQNGEFIWRRTPEWQCLYIPPPKRLPARYFPELANVRSEVLYISITVPGRNYRDIYALTSPTKESLIPQGINRVGYYANIIFNTLQKKHLEEQNKLLEEQKRLLERQSLTDGLTKLYNQRHYESEIAKQFSQAERLGFKLSVLMMDIDYFKAVNDTYGHGAGDTILKNVAATLKSQIRGHDLLARIGGEEFVIIAPHLNGVDDHSIMSMGERLRAEVEALRTNYEGRVIPVTISIGIATYDPRIIENNPYKKGYQIKDAADGALYHSKRNGRNRVTHSDNAPPES